MAATARLLKEVIFFPRIRPLTRLFLGRCLWFSQVTTIPGEPTLPDEARTYNVAVNGWGLFSWHLFENSLVVVAHWIGRASILGVPQELPLFSVLVVELLEATKLFFSMGAYLPLASSKGLMGSIFLPSHLLCGNVAPLLRLPLHSLPITGVAILIDFAKLMAS